MIEELKHSEFKKVTDIFIPNNQHLPVFSIINGNHPGRIFVDNKNNPKTAIAWATGRWAYIDGCSNNTDFNRSLLKFINETIISDSKNKLKMDWFELYTCGVPEWEEIISKTVKEFDSSKHFESVYIWDKTKFSNYREYYKFPVNLTVKKNNFRLLSEKAQRSSLVPKRFKTKTTYGFSVLSKEEELAHCRSTGFEVDNKFMINVITHDANQRKKGYAEMASVALLDFCIENKLIPLWETTEDNIGSQRLAKKLGFVKDQTYPVYAIEF
ncbi:MAG: GNAT family N-acetyltransferase [candidate division Zixibacteria bacterium]|nr:GNAT family N-acetyltransferase [candidate division Zixibacteria bacterium]